MAVALGEASHKKVLCGDPGFASAKNALYRRRCGSLRMRGLVSPDFLTTKYTKHTKRKSMQRCFRTHKKKTAATWPVADSFHRPPKPLLPPFVSFVFFVVPSDMKHEPAQDAPALGHCKTPNLATPTRMESPIAEMKRDIVSGIHNIWYSDTLGIQLLGFVF